MDALPSRPEVCVGAVVVFAGHLLMVQRANPPGAGRWSLPGGRVERGEPLAVALQREVQEEAGLPVEVGAMVGWVERVSDQHHFVILDFSCHLASGHHAPDQPEKLPPPTAGAEELDARWVRLEEVAALPLVDGLEVFLRERALIPDRTAGL